MLTRIDEHVLLAAWSALHQVSRAAFEQMNAVLSAMDMIAASGDHVRAYDAQQQADALKDKWLGNREAAHRIAEAINRARHGKV